MAYAFVQQAENDSSSTNQTSLSSGAFGASLTAGNLLVAHVWYDDDGNGAPVSITLSGASSPTWNAETVVSNGAYHLHSWYALNITGGATTALTATVTGGLHFNYPAIYVAEYSGFKTSGARLAFAGQNQATPTTATDAVTSGLLGTLSEQPAGIIALSFNEASDATPAAGTNFTALTACHDYGGSVTASTRPEHRRVTATTSVAGTFTAGSNQQHKTAAWAFSEAAGGGGAQITHKNGIALSGISHINGIAKASISAINGLTI